MTKYKRKPNTSQRDKAVLAMAKKMKQQGLLSKQTKLHGGKYVSQAVLKKVVANQHLSRLDYRPVKASKKELQAAKDQGFEVINGGIVGPNSNTFRARVRKGILTGVAPVKGGMMEQLHMPADIFTMRQLLERLGNKGIDNLKNDNEYFAFKIQGRMSLRPVLNSAELRMYFERYSIDIDTEIDTETVTNDIPPLSLVFFRLHRDDIAHSFPKKEERKRINKQFAKANKTGRNVYKSRDKYAHMHPNRAKIMMAREAESKRQFREKLQADPKALAEYKEKAKVRAANSRANRGK